MWSCSWTLADIPEKPMDQEYHKMARSKAAASTCFYSFVYKHCSVVLPGSWTLASWASYQIRNIAGCACAGNAGKVFPRRRFQRKPLVSDPGMHHGTCVTHVPWCMSGSLTCGDGKNVSGIPRACAPAILRIWQEAHDCGWFHAAKSSHHVDAWDGSTRARRPLFLQNTTIRSLKRFHQITYAIKTCIPYKYPSTTNFMELTQLTAGK